MIQRAKKIAHAFKVEQLMSLPEIPIVLQLVDECNGGRNITSIAWQISLTKRSVHPPYSAYAVVMYVS